MTSLFKTENKAFFLFFFETLWTILSAWMGNLEYPFYFRTIQWKCIHFPRKCIDHPCSVQWDFSVKVHHCLSTKLCRSEVTSLKYNIGIFPGYRRTQVHMTTELYQTLRNSEFIFVSWNLVASISDSQKLLVTKLGFSIKFNST